MKKETHRYFSIISHQNLEDLEFWDYELDRDFNSPAGMQAPDSAEILLTVANFDCESSLATIDKILKSHRHLCDMGKYTESVHSSLLAFFGDTVADLLMLSWQNDNECTTIAAVKDLLTTTAENIFSFAASFCNAISSDLDKDQKGSRIATVINTFSMTFPPDILYRPIPALSKSTGEIIYCDSFAADSAFAALYLCFVLTVREKKQIRRCKVCGKYFIPSAKSNEIYCKSCRKTTYDTKIKQDEILKTYRTIYKTQNARKQRNSHRPHIAEKFAKWKEYAKSKLQQCQIQEITLEEMKEAISSDSWINEIL